MILQHPMYSREVALILCLIATGFSKNSQYISDKYDWLGPFSMAPGEYGIDVQSLNTTESFNKNLKSQLSSSYTHALQQPNSDHYLSELVPGGYVGWQKVYFYMIFGTFFV